MPESCIRLNAQRELKSGEIGEIGDVFCYFYLYVDEIEDVAETRI